MKLSLPAVVMVFAGVILIYSGVKHRDPRNVVLEALGSKRRVADPYHGLVGVGDAVGRAAGEAAKKGAKALVPDPGARPPSTSGRGPIVSV